MALIDIVSIDETILIVVQDIEDFSVSFVHQLQKYFVLLQKQ